MRILSMTAAGGVLLAVATFSDAAVLCANPSGSVFVRDACKGNETAVNPASLGLARTISGFVYGNGTTYGGGFAITKLENGRYELRFPAAAFTNFPAIAVSAWGVPGVHPTINVFYNIFDGATNSWLAEVRIVGADGSTLVDTGFQFVAAQVQ